VHIAVYYFDFLTRRRLVNPPLPEGYFRDEIGPKLQRHRWR
jgi:hypothetical protein